MSTEYQNLVAAAKTAKRTLMDAGFSEEHADEIHRRILFLSGSYLPPVSGKFEMNLGDLRKV